MKAISCIESIGVVPEGLVAWLMNADGTEPSVRGCEATLLTLADRTQEAKVQFVVAAPKGAIRKLIEAANQGDSHSQALLIEDNGFNWLEQCSKVFMWSPRGESNTMGETLAMRELKAYFDSVDPHGNWTYISDQICRDSVGLDMSQVRKALKKVGSLKEEEPLAVTGCRRLTPGELKDLRRCVPEEWLTLLQDPLPKSRSESGLGCGLARWVRDRPRTAIGSAVIGGLALYLIYYFSSGGSEGGSPQADGSNMPDLDPRAEALEQAFDSSSIGHNNRYKTMISELELEEVEIPKAECHASFNAMKQNKGVQPLLGVGELACRGGSGELMCVGNGGPPGTCHRFGGPWKHDYFVVKEAIEYHLRNNRCLLLCDDQKEVLRNTWEETARRLPFIPSIPDEGFVDFSRNPSVPDLNDFEMMMNPRYPLVKSSSGKCVDCKNDPAIDRSLCDFAEVRCDVTVGVEPIKRMTAIGYNTTAGDVLRRMPAFSTKDTVFNVRKCEYDCRKMSPDLVYVPDLQVVETQPTDHKDPFKKRLSRRELSKLQLHLNECQKSPEGDWHDLPQIGKYPCGGGSGTMMCRKKVPPQPRSNFWYFNPKNWVSRSEDGPIVSCHQFGPLSMDAFAVEDAVHHYVDDAGDCFVRCDSKSGERRLVYQRVKDHLGDVLPEQKQDLAIALKKALPADPGCSSTCDSHVLPCPGVHNCVCRVVHSKCETEFKGDKGTVESWGLDARMEDVFGMLSVPLGNVRAKHPDVKASHPRVIKNCQHDCHGVLWSQTESVRSEMRRLSRRQ
ncbi:hypothetical protein GNI_094580 [Gregarina niphandrodes]|uniref:Uncharacterized protein n=1 Tax=Gregarina niphandrodes TaxID=110365 RepID=A0A023B551_GRENI|nr:hypothetical protein GNI_094580 [Gregarina niphandrodes]EZG58482.1 hypothetical protein GNI_094580 [Gregarina niphandrodes]|eukprot:XP_011130955.1 hypothetical protein GNI_094580 [Gregarina niphandrodes]